jgi:hypothetical protein
MKRDAQQLNMTAIDALAQRYAVERGALSELVRALQAEKQALERKYLGPIRKAVARARSLESELKAAVERSQGLFVKPRTLVLHGIKVGFTKGKGGIAWDDEDFVIARIERLYGDDPAMLEQLLIVKKRPRKEGLEKLDVATLKKLGCEVQESGDQVVVRAVDGEVDKLVAALLADEEEEAAP